MAIVVAVLVVAVVAVAMMSGSGPVAEDGAGASATVGGKTVREWRMEFGNPSDDVALQAARALAREGTAALPVLTATLQHGNSRERRYAARCATEMGPVASPAIAALLRALGDPDGEAKSQIACALVAIGAEHPGVIDGLARALRETRGEAQAGVVYAIGYLDTGAERLVPNLATVARQKGSGGQIAAIIQLGEMGSEARLALPALRDVARDLGQRAACLVAREAVRKIER